MKPTRIIIDTDPGTDDALAIFLALNSPELKIEALTAVAGNVPLELTLPNSLRLLEVARRTGIPVAAGADRPLSRRLVTAAYAHGENGLGGIQFPEPVTKPVAETATQLIRRVVHSSPHEIHIVAIGPLTNIAAAFREDPELPSLISHLTIMGGSLSGGNISPSAEFNMYVDPEAAQIVFRSGVALTMVGLDVTRRAMLREEHIRKLEASAKPEGRAAGQIARASMNKLQMTHGAAGPAMHDSLAMATLVDPSIVTLEDFSVAVETAGDFTAGETIGYRHAPMRRSAPIANDPAQTSTDFSPNAKVALDLNVERFLTLLVGRIAGAVLLIAFLTHSATAQVVQGFIRTTSGETIAGAVVSMNGDRHFSATTDGTGSYRLHAVHGGTYTLRANAGGYAPTTSGPLVLGQHETKKLDLTLKPLETEFFDEPNFVVAGVTDPTAHGGHGSDTLLRSTEVLTKEAASLGDAAPNQQNALETVRQYQRAAETDPTEPNYFDWASELLTHRATVPAIEVFTKGARLFPGSTRMILGLAVAWYTNGSDEKAQRYFFAACDMNPTDPKPYLFLGKVKSAAIVNSDGYMARLERFNKLDPENALASYYYAASLWKQRDSEAPEKVQALLEKAVLLDPYLNEAYLLLGILYSDRKDSYHAIAAFQKADLDEAHYRLAQEYRKIGDDQSAQKELDLYKELSRNSAEQAQKERLEIQQFVYSLR
jgi:pyrimidine-specific ribonucleoside hydrolase